MTKTIAIDRYNIDRLLGQGAMGRVYLANDPKLNREVALKVLAAKVDERTRERFELEARAIAVLKHPNIVELYDYSGREGNDLYLVLEYVPGKNLYETLLQRGPMRERTVLCVAHELSLALQHAHRFKVVHRDIKPENILLHRGRIVLADFGVIKVLEASELLGVDEIASHTQAIGTPGFMAPEQLEGRNIDHRCDIFAVGAVLYNLTTGHLPYESAVAEDGRFGRGDFVDPRTYVPQLTEDFVELVRRCVAIKPKERFDDPEELRDAILRGLAQHRVVEVRQVLEDYEVAVDTAEVADAVVAGPAKREAKGVNRALVAFVAFILGVGAGLGAFFWFAEHIMRLFRPM